MITGTTLLTISVMLLGVVAISLSNLAGRQAKALRLLGEIVEEQGKRLDELEKK